MPISLKHVTSQRMRKTFCKKLLGFAAMLVRAWTSCRKPVEFAVEFAAWLADGLEAGAGPGAGAGTTAAAAGGGDVGGAVATGSGAGLAPPSGAGPGAGPGPGPGAPGSGGGVRVIGYPS